MAKYDATASAWAKDCGVCHVGGGQMEYDLDMKQYGDPASTDTAGVYTYQMPYINNSGVATAGGVVLTSAAAMPQLLGDNKAEVDCMMCHANQLATGAAWYKSMGCNGVNMPGPADNIQCDGFFDAPFQPGVNTLNPDPRFTFTPGAVYDSFNRNMAVSIGWFKQAASAGIGALVNFQTGALSQVPQTIPGGSIAGTPNSANCAICHARTESDSIGLPMEAKNYGGMIVGYGNFFRMTPPGYAFDFDEVGANGNLASEKDGKNDTLWNEFGCKTGMGKRAHRSGYGSSDRFGFGICYGCAGFTAMLGAPYPTWYPDPNSICGLPSVQAACNAKAGGANLQDAWNPANNQWGSMAIFENPATGMPAKITGKMPDVDVHDVKGVKCADCHYTITATEGKPLPARTISGTVGGQTFTYTYPANTDIRKIDHMVAQGYSTLEKQGENIDGTVTCEKCHIDQTHPRKGTAKVPAHTGMPAIHFARIDCRTCHIPAVYSSPGRLLFRDWTAGAYRQADGSNGNANHFDFAFNFMDGAADVMRPLKTWVTTAHGTKITPNLPSLLPVWTGVAVKASDDSVAGWSPAKTRDITAAAAIVSAGTPSFGIRLNSANEHPVFQGFQLTDPLKIESKAKIDAMAAELGIERTGVLASHGTLRDPRMSLFPTMFDPSHGIPSKEWALGGTKGGGCVMCHSSSAVNPMTGQPINPATYSPKSIGFFDGSKELLKNGMMQMADYDCGEVGNTGQNMMFCGFFDMMGSTPGTCEPAEYAACKGYIGSNLWPQFGVPGDVAQTFPMDGIDMMQMMAIREGATAQGCNPILTFFGFPPAGRMNAGLFANNPNGKTNGCDPMAGDFYSRNEIRLYYKKNLQQSMFNPTVAGSSWVSPVTNTVGTVPATMGRVFGIVSVDKNPANAAHANKFDLGATCITDPMTGATGPCTDGGYVKTSVSQNQLLGYTTQRLGVLMSPGTAAISTPFASFIWTADTTTNRKVNLDASASTCPSGNCTYSWTTGGGTPASSTGIKSSSTYADTALKSVTLTVTDNVSGLSATRTRTDVQPSAASANTAPVANYTFSKNNATVTLVDTSTDAQDATNLLSVRVTWGDGTSTTQAGGTTFTKTYAAAGTYIIGYVVTDRGGLQTRYDANKTEAYPGIQNRKVAIVSSNYSISGSVTAPAGVTTIILRKKIVSTDKWATVQTTTVAGGTNVPYSFTVRPGDFRVRSFRENCTSNPVVTPSFTVTNADATGKNFTVACP